jgi:hypothetical protein
VQLRSRWVQVHRIRHGLLWDFFAGQRAPDWTACECIRAELASDLQRLLGQGLCYLRPLLRWI